MEKIRNFEFEFKCQQNPKEFTPTEGGHFCSHCNKTVYDFSDKSLEDLLQFFETRGTSFCGSFSKDQLKPKRSWSNWFSAALLFIGAQIPFQTQAQQAGPFPPTADINEVKEFGGSVEILPQFPGGEVRLQNYVRENLVVPRGTPEGRVFLTFVVDKTGSVRDLRVLKSLSEKADAEAIRVIAQGPKWTPGVFNGRPINLSYSMPIFFKRRD